MLENTADLTVEAVGDRRVWLMEALEHVPVKSHSAQLNTAKIFSLDARIFRVAAAAVESPWIMIRGDWRITSLWKVSPQDYG